MKLKLKAGAPIDVLYMEPTSTALNLARINTKVECEIDDNNLVNMGGMYQLIFKPAQQHPTYHTVYGWQFTAETYMNFIEPVEYQYSKSTHTTSSLYTKNDELNDAYNNTSKWDNDIYKQLKKIIDKVVTDDYRITPIYKNWYDTIDNYTP